MKRLGIAVAIGLVLACGATLFSYAQARQVAAAYVGDLPPNVVQFRTGLVPLRRTADAGWVWSISYGPRAIPGHVGFEIYVAPGGSVIGTNPAGLDRREPSERERSRSTVGAR